MGSSSLGRPTSGSEVTLFGGPSTLLFLHGKSKRMIYSHNILPPSYTHIHPDHIDAMWPCLYVYLVCTKCAARLFFTIMLWIFFCCYEVCLFSFYSVVYLCWSISCAVYSVERIALHLKCWVHIHTCKLGILN